MGPARSPKKPWRRRVWATAVGGSFLFHVIVLLGAYGHLGLFDPIELPFEPIQITAPSALGTLDASSNAAKGSVAEAPPPSDEMVEGKPLSKPRQARAVAKAVEAKAPKAAEGEVAEATEPAHPAAPTAGPAPAALRKAIEVVVRLDRIRAMPYGAALSQVAQLAPDGRRILPPPGPTARFDVVRDLDLLRVVTNNPRDRWSTSFVGRPRPGLGPTAIRIALSGPRFTHWVQSGAQWVAQRAGATAAGQSSAHEGAGAAGGPGGPGTPNGPGASSGPGTPVGVDPAAARAGGSSGDPRQLVVLEDGRVVYAAANDVGYFVPAYEDTTPDGLALELRIPDVAVYLRMRSGPTPRSLRLTITAANDPDIHVEAPYGSDEEAVRAEAWWTSRLAKLQSHPMVGFVGLGAFSGSLRVVRTGSSIEVSAHLTEAEVSTALSLLINIMPSLD